MKHTKDGDKQGFSGLEFFFIHNAILFFCLHITCILQSFIEFTLSGKFGLGLEYLPASPTPSKRQMVVPLIFLFLLEMALLQSQGTLAHVTINVYCFIGNLGVLIIGINVYFFVQRHSTVMIQSIRTDRSWQTVQTQIRLLLAV